MVGIGGRSCVFAVGEHVGLRGDLGQLVSSGRELLFGPCRNLSELGLLGGELFPGACGDLSELGFLGRKFFFGPRRGLSKLGFLGRQLGLGTTDGRRDDRFRLCLKRFGCRRLRRAPRSVGFLFLLAARQMEEFGDWIRNGGTCRRRRRLRWCGTNFRHAS